MTVVDLFAGGARGWCHAARQLGLDPLGIELDDAACRVSRAAGFPTLQADVSALDPLDFAPVTGLVGGAPCPSFSMAGKGIGRAAIPFLTDAIGRMAHGETIDRAELDAACADATAHLVLEPLRWALALRPRWLAQEQVEPVLPLWEATAAALRLHGYWAWCGVLSAEQYGIVATCPVHDPAPVRTATKPWSPARLAIADPAGMPWADGPESHVHAARLSKFATKLASVRNASTGSATTDWPTAALSDAWTVASLARDVLDAAPDATWHASVLSLLARALPERPTRRGRAAVGWTNVAMSGSGWMDANGDSITWSPSAFWAALCDLARSYITSTSCLMTTHPTTSGSSSPTAITCTSTTAARSRAACSLCDDVAAPQTRRRAILLASLDGPVSAPVATHQRYVAPRRQEESEGLFALPEPERIVLPEDRHLLPWVSMAQALGWGMTVRPSTAVVCSSAGGGSPEARCMDGGSGTRETIRDAREAGRWQLRANSNSNAAVRCADEPAPTITAGHDSGRSDGLQGQPESSARTEAVRVSLEEAAILQGFAPGHPWLEAGSKSAAYKCVGNAIPPQMALAALLAVVPRP